MQNIKYLTKWMQNFIEDLIRLLLFCSVSFTYLPNIIYLANIIDPLFYLEHISFHVLNYSTSGATYEN